MNVDGTDEQARIVAAARADPAYAQMLMGDADDYARQEAEGRRMGVDYGDRCDVIRQCLLPEGHPKPHDYGCRINAERLARALEELDTGPDGHEYSHTYAVDSPESFAAAIAAEYDRLGKP